MNATLSRSIPRLVLVCCIVLSLFASLTAPARLLAQDDTPPPDTSEQPLAVEDPNATETEPVEELPVTAAEVTDTPVALVSQGVSSYSAPSPGVYWITESLCPIEPPSAAAAEGEVDPAAVDAANDFLLQRKTYAGLETRTLQQIADPSTGAPWNCPDMYVVRSNVVADQTHVYWIDNRGLVRVPVTASPGDPQEVVDAAWRTNLRATLAIKGDHLVGTFNNNATGGQIIMLASSTFRLRNLATGVSSVLASSMLGINANFNTPSVDGTHAYYKQENNLRRVALVDGSNTLIANNVGAYSSAGRRSFTAICGQNLCITTTHYLYYVRNLASSAEIWRHNFVNGETLRIQNRTSEQRIEAILASSVPGLALGGAPPALFWFERVHTPPPPGEFGGIDTWSLMRAGIGQNAAIDNLNNRNSASLDAISSGDLQSNGEFLLWTEGFFSGRLMRIANDAAALPIVNMRVTGIEVTQGIQTNANDVRLIRGRQTFVRVFVESDGADVGNVTMRLDGPGPYSLYPLSPTQITVKGSPDRDVLSHAFLFQLPEEWTQQTSIGLTGVLNPFHLPFEPTYTDNLLTPVQIPFSPAYPMNLVLYKANYVERVDANTTVLWNVTDTWSHIDRIRRSYPVAEDGLSVTIGTITGGEDLGARVLRTAPDCLLMKAKDRSLCAANWVIGKLVSMLMDNPFDFVYEGYHYGLINDGALFPRGRVLDIGLPLGAGPTGGDAYGFYTAHEVGHMLGRPHPAPNSDDPETSAEEGCGHSRSDPFYPYADALIGPGDGSVRGFDRAQPTSGAPRFAILDDQNAFDVMSYCGDAQLRWSSPYTWELMYNWLKDHDYSVSAAQTAVMAGSETILVVGNIFDTDVAVQEVARLDSAPILGVVTGAPYALRLLDSGGAELARYGFEVGDPDDGSGFVVVAPWVNGSATVQIVDAATDTELWRRSVSPSAPVVSNVAISAGASPVTGTIPLNWTSTDADGDPLFHDLYRSTDGGVTWMPVSFGLAQPSAQIDTTTLPGGENRFKVASSDGVNRGSAVSNPIVVAPKPPEITITTPGNDTTHAWNAVIAFNAVALDLVDGLMTGDALEWRRNGMLLGTGSSMLTSALPPGESVVTLTATNSAGLTASKSVTIFLADELASLPTTLVAAPAILNVQMSNGATAPVQRTIALDTAGQIATLEWSAASSAPWLTLGSTDGANLPAALTVTINPAALAPNTLHEAEIVFTGTPGGGSAHTFVVPVRLAIGNTFDGPTAADVLPDGALWLPLIDR